MNFLKRTYNWTLEKAQHKNAKWYLSLISFAESSFFPIPPDILLIPMALASKAKALFYAFICTLFSVLGCLLYTSPSPRDRYISRMPSSA